MGVMHPLGPILDAAVSLKREPVRFLFIGDGASRPALISRASIEGLDRVSFLPFQPDDRFAEIMAACDASFVVLQPGLERLAVPSKPESTEGRPWGQPLKKPAGAPLNLG